MVTSTPQRQPKPAWLKARMPAGERYNQIKGLLLSPGAIDIAFQKKDPRYPFTLQIPDTDFERLMLQERRAFLPASRWGQEETQAKEATHQPASLQDASSSFAIFIRFLTMADPVPPCSPLRSTEESGSSQS